MCILGYEFSYAKMKRRQTGWVTVQDFTQLLLLVGTFCLAYMAGPDLLLWFRLH